MPASLLRGDEHRRRHRFHSLFGLAISLVLLLVVFSAPMVAGESDSRPPVFADPLEPAFIPPTEHEPPPPAPPMPVAEDKEVLETVQDACDLNQTFVPSPSLPGPELPLTPPGPPPPPPPPSPSQVDPPDNVVDFLRIGDAPRLIGGIEGLQGRVDSPELARKAEIEGIVVIQFVVNEYGEVVEPVVVRSPMDLLSQAALEAVRDSRFVPGQQRGRPVKVRYSLPVRFVLR